MKTAGWIIRITIALTILGFILYKVNPGTVVSVVTGFSLWVWLGLVIIAFFRHYTQYANWRDLLKIVRTGPGAAKNCSRSYMVGLSLRFLLPGGWATFGKAHYLPHHKKAALMAVMGEKFLMGWANLTFALLGAGWLWNKIWVIGLGFVSLLCITIVLFLPDSFKGYSLERVRGKIKKHLPVLCTRQILYSALSWAAFGLMLPVSGFMANLRLASATAVVQGSNLIPITISGLGLREAVAYQLMPLAGWAAQYAVAASLAFFLVNDAVPGVIGLYFMLSKR